VRFAQRGQSKVHVSGVLLLHSISANKFTQTANRVTNMIKNLCGDVAMKHVALCITMWDKVTDEVGYGRYDELCEMQSWKEMISKGASTALISNVKPEAKAEAEEIVSQLINDAAPVELAIQDEIVNQKLTLGETGAGKVLDEGLHDLQDLQAKAEREMEEIQSRLRRESETRTAKAQEEIRGREKEVAKLKMRAEAQAFERRTQEGRLEREQQRMKREMAELRRQTRMEGNVNAAKVQEELLAREKKVEQLKQKANELMEQGKLDAKQLQEERKIVEQARDDAQNKAKKEAVGQAAKAKEEKSAKQREINELKRRIKSQRGSKVFSRWRNWRFF